jgi:hypothetical protein
MWIGAKPVLGHLGQGEAGVAAAVRAHAEAHQPIAGGVAGLDGQGAGPVAEQDTGAAVVPVEPAAELVGPDHQHPPHGAAADVLGRRDQGEQEAAAGRREIEGHRPVGPQGRLHPRSRAEQVVRAGGGQQDQIHLLGGPARMGQGGPARLGGQAGDGFTRAGHAPGADAGAAADPVVVGVDPLAQLVVTDAGGGEGASAAHQSHSPQGGRGPRRV